MEKILKLYEKLRELKKLGAGSEEKMSKLKNKDALEKMSRSGVSDDELKSADKDGKMEE